MVELHITVRFPVSQLSSLNPQLNKAALRLMGHNPFGSQASHFPYPRSARQRKTFAVAIDGLELQLFYFVFYGFAYASKAEA